MHNPKQPLIKSLTQDDKTNPSYLSSSTFVDGLLALIKDKAGKAVKADNTKAVPDSTLALIGTDLTSLHTTLNAIPSATIQPILKSLLAGANNPAEARQKIEKWFDEGMDRATGWYKKQVRYWMLGIAMAVTIIFNVDTFIITKELMSNSKLRATLVASAEETVKQPVATNNPTAGSNTVAAIEKKITDLQLPIGWVKFVNQNSPTIATNQNSTTNLVKSLPDGKNNTVITSVSPLTYLRPGQTIPMMICGWLVTAAALSFGAPFWFDLLGKLVNVRAAGKKPEAATPPKNEEPNKPVTN